MTSKSDKEKQKRLEEQQAADRARSDAAMAVAAAPKPVETALETEQLDWMNATSGKNGPLDIYNLKAMKPNLALYDAASKRQESERYGTGALQLGQQGSNPMLAQLLRSQSDDQRQQDAAGGLENAYRMTDASMRGNMLPLLAQQQNRSMGLAGMASGNSQNSTNQYANFRPAPSFWQNLLLTGVAGAAQVGSAMAGRPPGASDSRLKDNIEPMADVVEKLKQIKGVTFTWNDNAKPLGLIPGVADGGVLADEVEKVFPDLVVIGSDGYRRVKYMALTGLLVEAMKFLERENAELRQQLA